MTFINGLESTSFTTLIKRGEIYSFGLFGLVLVAFAFLTISSGISGMIAALSSIGFPIVGLILMLALGNYFFRALRFRYLLGRQGFGAAMPQTVAIYVAGFALTATPGKVGEMIRMWLLKSASGLSYRKTLPVMIADRAYDVLATTLLCIVTLGTFSKYVVPSLITATFFVGGCVLLIRPRLLIVLIGLVYRVSAGRPRLFGQLRHAIRSTSKLFNFRVFVVGLALSCIGWFLECMALYGCATSLSSQITIQQAVFIFTFANLVGALTLLPGGIGGTEISMTTLLVTGGLTLEQAAAVTLIIRVGTLWFGMACGYLALFSCINRERILGKIVELRARM